MSNIKITASRTVEPFSESPNFVEERSFFEQELEAYYSLPPLDIKAWESELHAHCSANPEWLSFQHKAFGYQFMAENCPVHIFRHCPFFLNLTPDARAAISGVVELVAGLNANLSVRHFRNPATTGTFWPTRSVCLVAGVCSTTTIIP